MNRKVITVAKGTDTGMDMHMVMIKIDLNES
jgi:hypothetical protein